MNKRDLTEKINELDLHDRHRAIIEIITRFPDYHKDIDLMNLLTAAYINSEDYSGAAAVLRASGGSGQYNSDWFYLSGLCAYYRNEKQAAFDFLDKACSLGNENAMLLIESVKKELRLENRKHPKSASPSPLVLSREETDAIENHIELYFGSFDTVLHEISSPDLHIDLAIVPPSSGRAFYTAVTVGASAYKMDIPENYPAPDRTELLICLPPDWDFSSPQEEYYWPLRWLKIAARLSLTENTWLGTGHTIPNGEPFAGNTELSSILVTEPFLTDEKSRECILPGGEKVSFLQLVPLHENELKYKLKHSAESLKKIFGTFPYVIDPKRECAVRKTMLRRHALPESGMLPLFRWDGPMGCIASERIIEDGEKVGYMYRIRPSANTESDSGWRFISADEDEEYLDNPDSGCICSLNTLANYDKSIIPLLNSGYNTAFRMNSSGEFVKEKYINNP